MSSLPLCGDREVIGRLQPRAVNWTRALIAIALVMGLAQRLGADAALDAAFDRFWKATTVDEALSATAAIVAAKPSFDEAYARLEKGRPYRADVPKGVIRLSHRVGAIDYPYMLDVPASYDPAKAYPVRIQLHGGVGRPEAAPRGNGIGALAGAEQIYILPTAWADAEWWTNQQLENIRWILDSVKRSYNVDENRVVLSGVSDGGTGTYYVAMRDTTPFAAFLPLNGAVAVLRSSNVRIDGEMFQQNFVNKPFFIVNGGRDPLYPTTLVEPYINKMTKGGVEVQYLPQPEAGHNTAWWPEVKGLYEAFVSAHPRRPLPDTLTWESDLTAGTGRAHWLVIDALAKPRADATPLPDINDVVAAASEPSFGIRAAGTRVTGVAAGSNAATFGLQAGDVITKIGPRPIPAGVDVLDLLSIIDPGASLALTVERDGATKELSGTYNPVSAPRVTSMFDHVRPSGRVDLVRRGNTVTATTRGVAAFTLLVSPQVFDLRQPITVVADGKTVFSGRVTSGLETLLEWAARDNDRTMLFAAEVKVTLTP